VAKINWERYFAVEQFLDDAEAVQAGHLNIEKDQVRDCAP